MTVKELVVHTLEDFSEAELETVAEFLAFLKFRARVRAVPTFDSTKVAALYAEFADEDRELAEAGVTDYHAGLQVEDAL